MQMDNAKGMLYICATPIGNLEDITYRAVRMLQECDAVACEDTRQTVKLLNHLNIKKPMISYHKYNETSRSQEIIKRLENGEKIVLVSDAGMPGISDPGFVAVSQARENGYPVSVLPGASAGICALVLSGMPCDRFVFEGFLPTENKALKKRLEALKTEERTVILYESPHRLKKTLKILFEALGERAIALTRELTKIHEECVVTTLAECEELLQDKEARGEYVLILHGVKPEQDLDFAQQSIQEQVLKLMKSGMNKKDAVKETARLRNLPKNAVYQQTLEL